MKEIKKALEDNANYEHHNKLGYIDGYKCKTVAFADILTLINELESENKVLKNKLGLYQGLLDEIGDKNLQLKNRISELEEGIAQSMLGCEFLPECTTEKEKEIVEKILSEFDNLQENLSKKIEQLKEPFRRNMNGREKESYTNGILAAKSIVTSFKSNIAKQFGVDVKE